MAIDDKIRDAYKEGQKDADNPVGRFLEGLLGDKSDSEIAAYDKGAKGEQLDGDKKDDD